VPAIALPVIAVPAYDAAGGVLVEFNVDDVELPQPIAAAVITAATQAPAAELRRRKFMEVLQLLEHPPAAV
jgi:hypothetical protein